MKLQTARPPQTTEAGQAARDTLLRGLQALDTDTPDRARQAGTYLTDPAGHGMEDQCDGYMLRIAADQCHHLRLKREGATTSAPTIDADLLGRAYATRDTYGRLADDLNRHRALAEGHPVPARGAHIPVDMMWDRFGISWTINTATDLAGAWALTLVTSGRFDEAHGVLATVADFSSPLTAAARIDLYLETQRWGDLIEAVEDTLGARALADPALASIARACLGLAQASIGNPLPAADAFAAVETGDYPVIAAWALYQHALLERSLNHEDKARSLLSRSMTASYTAQAEAAIHSTAITLRVTTRDLVDTRTDRWDVNTEDDPEARRALAAAESRDAYRQQAEALLDRQVGMENVKAELRSIANGVRMDVERKRRGLATKPSNYNTRLEGPPGTGKTTIAKAFVLFLAAYGVVDDPDVMMTTPADFIDKHIGGSGEKTLELLSKTHGKGVLIDEAHAFISDDSGSTGADSAGIQAIRALVSQLENLIGVSVFFIAGYPEQIAKFLRADPGLPRRFPRTIRFHSFTLEQLAAVARVEAEKAGLILSDEAEAFIRDENGPARHVFATAAAGDRTVMDDLGNGGFARSIVQEAAMRLGNRNATVDLSTLTTEELNTLSLQDVSDSFNAMVYASIHGERPDTLTGIVGA